MTTEDGIVRFGVLGAANIGRKVIPGMDASAICSVDAVASRDLSKAEAYAEELSIPRAYGSYEELLGNPDIDAVYIPLPNHMHAEWSIAAVRGKGRSPTSPWFAISSSDTASERGSKSAVRHTNIIQFTFTTLSS